MGDVGRRLKLVNGMAVELPNRVIKRISERSEVLSVHFDRPIAEHMNRTAVSVGARAAQQQWGYDGAGVGVAVIDSGIASWHDDLSYHGSIDQGSSGRRAARDGVRRLRQQPACSRVRRQRARHARRRHHRRQRLRLLWRARRHRAGGAPGQPEGARSARRRRHQRRHRGVRVGGRQPRERTTSASSTCRLARASPSRTKPIR